MNGLSLFDERKANFQVSIVPEEMKKRFDNNAVVLRRKKRDEYIRKRRALIHSGFNQAVSADQPMATEINFPVTILDNSLRSTYPGLFSECISSYERFLGLIGSIQEARASHTLQHLLKALRLLLSQDLFPECQLLFERGIVMILISNLQSEDEQLISESIWNLINLSAGPPEYSRYLISLNIFPVLISLLEHPRSEIAIQVVWILANLTGDNKKAHEVLLEQRLDEKLLEQLNKRHLTNEQIAVCIWGISNLLMWKTEIANAKLSKILNAMPHYLAIDHEEVKINCAWTISYISNKSDEAIQLIINSGVMPMALELLKTQSTKLQVPILRVIGNFAASEDSYVEYLLNLGLLDKLLRFCSSDLKSFRKEALWILSNVTASKLEHVQRVLDHSCLPLIVKALSDTDYRIKKEAVWAIGNITTWHSLALKVLDIGAFEPLCKILEHQNSEILICAIKGIDNILTVAKKVLHDSATNEILVKFDEVGGLSALERLQNHSNSVIYQKAARVLTNHFDVVHISEVSDLNEKLYN